MLVIGLDYDSCSIGWPNRWRCQIAGSSNRPSPWCNYVDRLILQAAAQQLGASVTALHQKEERLPTKGQRFRRFLLTAMEHSAATDEVSLGVPAFLTEEYESPVITRGLDLEDAKYIQGLQVVIQDLVAQGNVVIVGRGSPLILREAPHVLKVGLVANRRDCVARIMEREHLILSRVMADARQSTGLSA